MIDTDFSITHRLLDALQEHDQKIGNINSFFVVHITGGLATAITAALDTLIHLTLSIVKAVTGIFATPFFYFTDSPYAEQWTWAIAGKHFMEAIKHAAGVILAPPTTFLFSPNAALDLLFDERIEIKRLRELEEPQDQLIAILRNNPQAEALPNPDLQRELEEQKARVGELEEQLEEQVEQTRVATEELEALKVEQREAQQNINELMDQLHNAAKEQSSSSLEGSDDQAIIKLKTDLDEANEKLVTLQAQSIAKGTMIRRLTTESNLDRGQIVKLRDLLEQKDEEIQSLMRQLEGEPNSTQDIIELKKRLSKEQDNLSILRIEIDEKDEQIQKLNQQHDNLLAEKIQLENKNKASLQNDRALASVRLQFEQLQIQNEDLQRQLDKSNNIIKIQSKEEAERVENLNRLLADRDVVVQEQADKIRQFEAKPLDLPSAIPQNLKDAVENLAVLLTCELDAELFKDASIIPECGHVFNGTFLQAHIEKGRKAKLDDDRKTGPTCPTCTTKTEGCYPDNLIRKVAVAVEEIQEMIPSKDTEV